MNVEQSEQFAELLAHVKTRKRAGRFGIGTAEAYLLQTGVLDEFTDYATGARTQALREAGRKLTYCAPDLECSTLTRGVSKSLPDGACAQFDAVITSTRKDRDGDILEAKGARPDPKMPLLWQHNSTQPIGKLLGITKHDENQVGGRFAIIDTPLGRDAAQLLEFEALRISHGFLPLKFKPLTSKSGDDLPAGWRILEFEIMETSLVSVPSNIDAIVSSLHRDKFASPSVKRWAKSLERATDQRDLRTALERIQASGLWKSLEADELNELTTVIRDARTNGDASRLHRHLDNLEALAGCENS